MQKNTQYTRCPQCDTAFKVSDKMLAMAHGKVRCGACLEVFLATDHLLQPRDKGINTVASAASDKATQAKEDEPAPAVEPSHEEPYIGDLDSVNTDIEEALSTSPQISSVINDDASINTEDESFDLRQSEQAIVDDKETDVESIDEEFLTPEDDDLGLSTQNDEELDITDEMEDFTLDSVASELEDLHTTSEKTVDELNDIDMAAEGAAQSEPSANFDEEHDIGSALIDDEPMLDLELIEASESKLDDSQTHVEPTDRVLDADVADATDAEKAPALEEDELLDSDTELDTDTELDSELDTLELQMELQQAEQEDELREEEETESLVDDPDMSEFDSEQIAMEDQEHLDRLSQTLTAQISDTDTEPDPLDEFEGRVEKKKTSLRTLVIIATAVTLMSVLSVNFWSNRQSLAWDDTWGGFTHAVCALLPCDIQPQRDITKIRLRQRIVTPSEDTENQLDVKILLTNEASFAQPYPRIIIKFSNSSGEQVAIKQFEVAEYFPAKQNELMPAGTEIHIAFSTEQPHPDALGFEFNFQ